MNRRMTKSLVFSTLCVLGSGCGEDPPPPEPVVRPVRTQPVYATGGGRSRSFSGMSQAALESRLSFKVAGTVSRLAVAVGDRVKPGALIAKIDGRDQVLQVQEAEAGRNSAKRRPAAQSRITVVFGRSTKIGTRRSTIWMRRERHPSQPSLRFGGRRRPSNWRSPS